MKFSTFIPALLSVASSTLAQSFCNSSSHTGQSIKVTNNNVGYIGNVGFEMWADSGNNSATFYSDGSFSCTFNNAMDYLCRSGLSFDSTKTHSQIGHMYADFKLVKQNIYNVDYSFVGVYGWTRNPLVEYYIVDNWLSQWRPGDWVGNVKHGNYNIDGAQYTVYENTRYGPSIDGSGNTNFKQYFSIRQQARDCGTIDITAHFQKWESLGMQMGKLHEAKILGEAGSNGYGTSGTADFPYAKVYIGNNNNNSSTTTKNITTTTTTTTKKITTTTTVSIPTNNAVPTNTNTSNNNNSSNNSNCVPRWAQCGGYGYESRCCSEGTCVEHSPYYHQCV